MVTKFNDVDSKILSTSGLFTKKKYDSEKQCVLKNIEVLTKRY